MSEHEYEYDTIDAEPVWRDQIRKIATHHPVLGGDDEAPMNVSSKDLADCVAYLKVRDWSDPVTVTDVGNSFVPALSIPWIPASETELVVLVEYSFMSPGLALARWLCHAVGPDAEAVSTLDSLGASGDLILAAVADGSGLQLSVRWSGGGTRTVRARYRVDWFHLHPEAE